MMLPDFRFRKHERLNSKKQIAALFNEGKRLSVDRLTLIYDIIEDQDYSRPRIMISVPKKLFKKAVHRNLIKRRIREAYRLNKMIINEPLAEKKKTMLMAFLYRNKEISDYKTVHEDVVKLLKKLTLKI